MTGAPSRIDAERLEPGKERACRAVPGAKRSRRKRFAIRLWLRRRATEARRSGASRTIDDFDIRDCPVLSVETSCFPSLRQPPPLPRSVRRVTSPLSCGACEEEFGGGRAQRGASDGRLRCITAPRAPSQHGRGQQREPTRIPTYTTARRQSSIRAALRAVP